MAKSKIFFDAFLYVEKCKKKFQKNIKFKVPEAIFFWFFFSIFLAHYQIFEEFLNVEKMM